MPRATYIYFLWHDDHDAPGEPVAVFTVKHEAVRYAVLHYPTKAQRKGLWMTRAGDGESFGLTEVGVDLPYVADET